MRNRDYQYRHNERRPGVAIGIFLVVLGLALLVATNDLFNLGSMSGYFNWKTAMIFIGVVLLLNLEFTGGILLVAGGVWFLREELFPFDYEQFEDFFWPAVIALSGISLILKSIIRRRS
ncbi:MAG TPA: DUF5668 domain-containing protein [Bacteroidales bacterium]|nr:DUF5668 domain-containing protein [Bacteroidales bacterium]